MSPLLVNLGIAAASLAVVSLSAGYILTAVIDYGRKTGISDYLIGFLIVSMGTSLPELTTGIVASLAGAGSLVLGDVLGASILDVTLILGIISILGRRIFIQGAVLTKTVFTVLVMAMLPIVLGFDGSFSRLDGAILVLGFLVYVGSLLHKEGKFGKIRHQLSWREIWQDMLVITGCVIALLMSAHWFVRSALNISGILGIPEFIMGLVLVAMATSSPELIVEIKAVLRGSTGICFGDILGSVVTNCSLVLGIAALIRPIVFERARFISTSTFMLTSVFIALLFIKKKEVTWQEGLGLLMIYITFLITEGLARML